MRTIPAIDMPKLVQTVFLDSMIQSWMMSTPG
jgi:hypothetical protein